MRKLTRSEKLILNEARRIVAEKSRRKKRRINESNVEGFNKPFSEFSADDWSAYHKQASAMHLSPEAQQVWWHIDRMVELGELDAWEGSSYQKELENGRPVEEVKNEVRSLYFGDPFSGM